MMMRLKLKEKKSVLKPDVMVRCRLCFPARAGALRCFENFESGFSKAVL